MNFLPITTTDSGIAIESGPRIPFKARCEAGRGIILGVRPEHLLAPVDGEIGIAMTVDVVEPTGPELRVHGKIANHPVMMGIRERRKLSPGVTIRVELYPLHCHLFDRRTESPLPVNSLAV